MRKSFLAVLLVLILALPLSVLAKEYELGLPVSEGFGTAGHFYSLPPSPLMPGQIELYWDAGSTSSYTGWASYGIQLGKYFDPGYSVWITGYKMYYYDYAPPDSTHLYFYDDSGGDPDSGTLLWDEAYSCSTSGWAWYTDTLDTPVYSDGYFYSVFAWGSYSETGGVGVDYTPTYHDYQNYGGWSSGWYAYYLRAFVNDDTAAPYADSFNPGDGGSGYPNSTIGFHVRDDDAGVNTSSISFVAEDESKGVISGTLDIDDSNLNDVVCTFTPDSDLPVGDTITCTLSQGLADVLGNATDYDIVWHFSVEPYAVLQPTSLGHIKAQYN